MNVKKLAELCNCSVGTISKAFSGKKDVSEQTRQKIFNVAKAQGCFERYYKGRFEKKVFAFIVPELKSDHYSKMAAHVSLEIEKKGALSIVCEHSFSSDKAVELINYFATGKKIDGVMIVDTHAPIKEKEFPVIAINYRGKSKNVDSVNNSKNSAVQKAILHLKNNGHEKIAYIGENLTTGTKTAFVNALNSLGLAVNNDFILTSEKRFEEAGYECMQKIYSLSNRPTAIFAAYDNIALGAMNCIKDHGDNVPNDFSIIGRNDISFASHGNVSLTTINDNSLKLCDVAIDLMIKKLDRKYFKLKQQILIEQELIVRDSVKDLTKN